jgi:hypothetical protein
MRAKRPKLTLKAAKTIALQEIGTTAGLEPHENNNPDYQRYEMRVGNQTVVISNACNQWGVAYIAFAGTCTYYDITTLRVNWSVTDRERKKDRREFLRDAAASDFAFMFTALIEEHGLERCRHMLDDYGSGSIAI